MTDHSTFQHPLTGRYASKEMKQLFSDDVKFHGWRRFWLELARAEMSLGAPITQNQIDEMESHLQDEIDYPAISEKEAEIRHDVLAHIWGFGEACPSAKPILHLGATSCDITDNVDLITIRKAMEIICEKLARAIHRMNNVAIEYKNLPVLGYTHFQVAQLTTLGKRVCMWIQDLVFDLERIESLKDNLHFRGVKGVTGTQASFLKLFNGDKEKVRELEKRVAKTFSFSKVLKITGQTYSRRHDAEIICALSILGADIYKMAKDIRLLAHDKEIEEPFEEKQKGSSGMPYKRNPMRCERACALARTLKNTSSLAINTHGAQFLERTLDDSAARRIFIPEAFLLADSILILTQNIFEGLMIYPAIINRHIKEELPFMITEDIIIEMVNHGADREDVHTKIRDISQEAANHVKLEGLENNLIDLILADEFFSPVHNYLSEIINPNNFIGMATDQVEDFQEDVERALLPYQNKLGGKSKINI